MKMPIDPNETINDYEVCWDSIGLDIGRAKTAALKPIWWHILNQMQNEGYVLSEILQSLYQALTEASEQAGTSKIWEEAIDNLSQAGIDAYTAEQAEKENLKMLEALKRRITKDK